MAMGMTILYWSRHIGVDKPARFRFRIQIQYLSNSTKMITNTESVMLSILEGRQACSCQIHIQYLSNSTKKSTNTRLRFRF